MVHRRTGTEGYGGQVTKTMLPKPGKITVGKKGIGKKKRYWVKLFCKYDH